LQSGNDKLAEAEKNKKYTNLTAEAKALFDLKKYVESKESYKKALELRPGDLYASNQIEKIDKILNNRKGLQEQKKSKERYDSYMSEGEKALSKNMLAEARIAFVNALVFKENDPVATARIKTINDKENRLKEAQEVEK
jgi:tetratricopeptide (TPR) repeat protein